MTNLNASWNNLKNYLYKKYGKESGKMIVHLGVATWILASAAQVGAVIFNDKIPKAQKKFLVPQEIADGAINILAFYTVTNSLKNIAGRLVLTGKWTNRPIREFVKNNPIQRINLGDSDVNLSKIYANRDDFSQIYSPFKNGMDMAATTLGSVLSCNIIAPLVRNPIGAIEQKRNLKKESAKKQDISFKSSNVYYRSNMRV